MMPPLRLIVCMLLVLAAAGCRSSSTCQAPYSSRQVVVRVDAEGDGYKVTCQELRYDLDHAPGGVATKPLASWSREDLYAADRSDGMDYHRMTLVIAPGVWGETRDSWSECVEDARAITGSPLPGDCTRLEADLGGERVRFVCRGSDYMKARVTPTSDPAQVSLVGLLLINRGPLVLDTTVKLGVPTTVLALYRAPIISYAHGQSLKP